MLIYPKVERAVKIFAHVFTWSYIFLCPLFFKRSGESVDWVKYLHGTLLPVVSCLTFYLNYFYLIPHFLLRKRSRVFFAANLALLVLTQLLAEYQFVLFPDPQPAAAVAEAAGAHPYFPPKIFFVVRGILIYIFVVGVSLALCLSMKWRESEQARAKAEARRAEVELKNLKNQINPHFLLNTLNNIYALTAFDTDKAQQAIQELSRLLRYMLYDNQTDRVPLAKEVDFLRSYVALMSLRLAGNVEVTTRFDFPQEKDIQVSPLIFVSLVENAFKHGVSPTKPSFIRISLVSDGKELAFTCANSNFPKTRDDKTPGGIGLHQVGARLECTYPGRYTWESGVSEDGAVYTSTVRLAL